MVDEEGDEKKGKKASKCYLAIRTGEFPTTRNVMFKSHWTRKQQDTLNYLNALNNHNSRIIPSRVTHSSSPRAKERLWIVICLLSVNETRHDLFCRTWRQMLRVRILFKISRKKINFKYSFFPHCNAVFFSWKHRKKCAVEWEKICSHAVIFILFNSGRQKRCWGVRMEELKKKKVERVNLHRTTRSDVKWKAWRNKSGNCFSR